MEEEHSVSSPSINMSHTINMEHQIPDTSDNRNSSEFDITNIVSMFHTNRSERQNEIDPLHIRSSNEPRHDQHIHTPNSRNTIRPWRVRFNHMLPFSTASPSEALLSLLPNTVAFRNAHIIRPSVSRNLNDSSRSPPINTTSSANPSRTSTLRNNSTQDPLPAENGGIVTLNNNRHNILPNEDDTNFMSELFVKILSHFVRYLPFICIIFIKFIYDHVVGILDLALLHSVMFHANSSFKVQVSKLSQKSYWILLRDFCIVGFFVAYRFLLIDTTPDIFGLLINVPTNGVNSSHVIPKPEAKQDVLETILSLAQRTTSPPPLGVLLYYVAANDIIIKLCTVWIKIFIATIPTKLIRHKLKVALKKHESYYINVYLYFYRHVCLY